MLSNRISSMLIMSSSVCLFFESECSLTNRVLSDLKPNICICEFNDSCESAFKFMARIGFVKGRKLKGLDACSMVLRFNMFVYL